MKTRATLEAELHALMKRRANVQDKDSPEFAAAIEAINDWLIVNGQDLDATKHERAA